MVRYYYIFFVYFTLYQPEIKEKCKYQLKNNFLDSKMSRKVYLSDTEGCNFPLSEIQKKSIQLSSVLQTLKLCKAPSTIINQIIEGTPVN